MRASVFHEHGGPDAVHTADVPHPMPAGCQGRIAVHAVEPALPRGTCAMSRSIETSPSEGAVEAHEVPEGGTLVGKVVLGVR